MPHKIIYTADMHGNEIQYKKLADYAISESANSVIIGGDIAPKYFSNLSDYISGQKKFLQDKIPEVLGKIKEKLPESRIFLMMGNDDCAANYDIIENNNLFENIHGKRLKLTNNFDIVGYSYVPITPFKLKDWEKFDLSEPPASLKSEYLAIKMTNCRFEGLKSKKYYRWENFKFRPEDERKVSIQRDLSKRLYNTNPEKTVYAIHSPPYKTNLDQILSGVHVGSMALRLFIEKYQPHLTLHGHIHETVSVSGSFKDRIGSTLCLSAGNHDVGSELAVLVFDLYKPHDVNRIIL